MRKVLLWSVIGSAIFVIFAAGLLSSLMKNSEFNLVNTAEAQERVWCIVEQTVIFENGTQVKIGPIRIPYRVVEITEKGVQVLTPEYWPSEALVKKVSSGRDPLIFGRRTWTDQGSGWKQFNATYGYTFTNPPILATAERYDWSEYGHIEDKNDPGRGLGIYKNYFWWKVQASSGGYAGVDFYASGN